MLSKRSLSPGPIRRTARTQNLENNNKMNHGGKWHVKYNFVIAGKDNLYHFVIFGKF